MMTSNDEKSDVKNDKKRSESICQQSFLKRILRNNKINNILKNKQLKTLFGINLVSL